MYIRMFMIGAALSAIATPAFAQPPKHERVPALARVVNCRAIVQTAQRLACFDREVAALDAAEAARELVVMDRQQVRSTRRSLFGLALPDLGIFGENNTDDDAPAQLDSTIKSASQNAHRKWILTLEDGARWIQIDTRNMAIEPKAGLRIQIRRAGLGSYMANVAGQPGIRVRRIG
jgi:hypothetical protein